MDSLLWVHPVCPCSQSSRLQGEKLLIYPTSCLWALFWWARGQFYYSLSSVIPLLLYGSLVLAHWSLLEYQVFYKLKFNIAHQSDWGQRKFNLLFGNRIQSLIKSVKWSAGQSRALQCTLVCALSLCPLSPCVPQVLLAVQHIQFPRKLTHLQTEPYPRLESWQPPALYDSLLSRDTE